MILLQEKQNLKFTRYDNIILACIAIIVSVVTFADISAFVNPTVTGKYMCFIYGVLALTTVWVIYVVFTKALVIKCTLLDALLGFLVLYITINRYNIQEYYSFSIRYYELLGLSVLYIVLRTVSYTKYIWLLLVLLVLGTAQAVYGNLQLLEILPSNHNKFNITGSFFNPGPYAGFLAVIWALALVVYTKRTFLVQHICGHYKCICKTQIQYITQLFKYLPLITLGTILLVLPATRSRAALLALVLCSVCIFVQQKAVYLKKLKIKGTLIALIVTTVLLSLSFLAYQYKKDSADGRFLIWKVSKTISADYPWFGVGFDRFKAHYMNYQAHYFANQNTYTNEAQIAGHVDYAFNTFVQFLVENGIIGCLIALLIAGYIIRKMLRSSYNVLNAIIITTGLAIGAFGCFSYPMQILPIKLVAAILLAYVATLRSSRDAIINITLHSKLILLSSKTMMVILASAIIYQTTVKITPYIFGFTQWKEARYSFRNRLFEVSIKEYESVLPLFKNDGVFLDEYASALALQNDPESAALWLQKAEKHINSTVLQNTKGNVYKTLGNYQKAETAYLKASQMQPNLFYPNYLLVKLYDETKQYDKALLKANAILTKPIKVPSKAIDEMRSEMKTLIKTYKTSGFN